MKLTATRSAIYITLCVLAMASMASADSPTPVTACGTVITVAGKYSLANDLVGCDQFGVAIQTSNVTLQIAHALLVAVPDARRAIHEPTNTCERRQLDVFFVTNKQLPAQPDRVRFGSDSAHTIVAVTVQ